MFYPLKMQPAFKTTIWGGAKLRELFGKDCPDMTGESWEVSVHPNGESIVANGAHTGQSLTKVLGQWGGALTGDCAFEMLIKLLDAREKLSVQVHPDDEYAKAREGADQRGKTEAWYVLAAEPGAKLIYGLKDGVTPEAFAKTVGSDQTEDVLDAIDVAPGDVLYIPAGTVHAIGAGIVLYEIQQSSDLTYRVWDFNRRGADGMLRELHLEKAVEVTRANPPYGKLAGVALRNLPGCAGEETLFIAQPYFALSRVVCQRPSTRKTDGRYQLLTALEGGFVEAEGKKIDCAAGESIVMPAAVNEYTLSGTWLVGFVPRADIGERVDGPVSEHAVIDV